MDPLRFALLFAAVSSLLAAAGSSAHTGGTLSHAQWETRGTEAVVALRVRPADFRGLPAGIVGKDLGAFLVAGTRVSDASGASCALESAVDRPAEPGWASWRWTFRCREVAQSMRLEWLAAMPGHLHMVREGQATRVARGGAAVSLDLGATSPPALDAVLDQFGHGLRHIAAGWDHLAFLAGLLLLAPGLASLAALVTGFTAGHGLALVLATQAGVLPPSVSVELAIAASVLVVGIPARPRALAPLGVVLPLVAIASARPEDWMIWAGLLLLGAAHVALRHGPGGGATTVAGLVLAGVFGLLHGFGFAGAVIETARSAESVWPVLLGFNLGVEAGQLAFLLPAWWCLRRLRVRTMPVQVLRAAVCGMGTFWVTERLWQAW